MISVWKCSDCWHANKGEDGEACAFCGGFNRQKLHPVLVPNAQQNTPDLSRLEQELAIEESQRATDRRIDEMVRELVFAYILERSQHGKTDDSGA